MPTKEREKSKIFFVVDGETHELMEAKEITGNPEISSEEEIVSSGIFLAEGER